MNNAEKILAELTGARSASVKLGNRLHGALLLIDDDKQLTAMTRELDALRRQADGMSRTLDTYTRILGD